MTPRAALLWCLTAAAALLLLPSGAAAQTGWCSSLGFAEDAQAYLLPGDALGLDPDRNGVACDGLPRRPAGASAGVPPFTPTASLCGFADGPPLRFLGVPRDALVGSTVTLRLDQDPSRPGGPGPGTLVHVTAWNTEGPVLSRAVAVGAERFPLRVASTQDVELAARYPLTLEGGQQCLAMSRSTVRALLPLERLTLPKARRAVREALFDRFGATWEAGTAKRVARCTRRSRLRVRCAEVSWSAGDLAFSGRVTVWRAYEERQPTLRHALTIRRVDERCVATGGRGCSRTIRDP